jgi:hypothetical protein
VADRTPTVRQNPQATSRTAILAHVAAVYGGPRKVEDQPAWFRQNGLDIGARGLKDALKLRKRQPRDYRKRGRRSSGPAVAEPDLADDRWLEEALQIEAAALNLDEALVWISPEVAADALPALRDLDGAVTITETYGQGVLVRLVFDGRRRREALWRHIHELDPAVRWADVRRDDGKPAAKTWLRLARAAAQEEGHLLAR